MMRVRIFAATAIILIVIGAGTLHAQDLGFQAVQDPLPKLGSQGIVGASVRSGFINSTLNDSRGLQANSLPVFNAVDTAIGDFDGDGLLDIVAVSIDKPLNSSSNIGNLSIFIGLGDGSFRQPRVIKTAGLPAAITAADIDQDTIDDVVIAEQGFVEVFTGFFLVTGRLTTIDRFGLPNGGAAPNKALKTASGAAAAAVGVGAFDSDPISDILVLERGAMGGQFEVFLTRRNGVQYKTDGTSDVTAPTEAFIVTPISGDSSAPRALAIDGSSGGSVFIATLSGVEIFNVDKSDPLMPVFTPAPALETGDTLLGVTIGDASGDGLSDVITLQRDPNRLLVFPGGAVGDTGLTFGEPIASPIDPNPVTFARIKFNLDNIADIAVAHSPTGGNLGLLSILTGNAGFYRPAIAFNNARGLPVFSNPRSIVAGRLMGGSTGSPPNPPFTFADDVIAAEFSVSGNSPGGVLYLSSDLSYTQVRAPIFSAISQTADLDNDGNMDDLAVIEQTSGMVFAVINITTTPGPRNLIRVVMIDLSDLFTNLNVTPTSAAAFRNPLTGLNDVAITIFAGDRPSNSLGQIVIAQNGGAGDFDPDDFRQFAATPGATNIMSGDFNNDSFDDLAYIDYLSNFAAVSLNDGMNRFRKPEFRETGGFIPVSAVLADVNDDDVIDMVVVNQGSTFQFNQSIVSVLIGQGDGKFAPTGSLLQVPNFAVSIMGGLADLQFNNTRRPVDFNNDGFPDFAVVSTRGGFSNAAGTAASVTLLLNRPDNPGSFTVQPPIALVDDTPSPSPTTLQIEGLMGGPGVVSGRAGDPSIASQGVGFGGANYLAAVSDFNADGSPDIVVTGTRLQGANFRSSVYMVGNETLGSVRVVRPQRSAEYGGNDPTTAGGDAFIGCVVGDFSPRSNNLVDVLHISINGELWIDSNGTPIINHAPVPVIQRADLNAVFPGGGFKQIITAGETATIPVTAIDADNDILTFRLTPTPTGEEPPSFAVIQDIGGNSALINIESGDVNQGPGDLTFQIGVETSDEITQGNGNGQSLTGRFYFTLVIHPNSPPDIDPISNLSIESGKSTIINLKIRDKENHRVTTAVKCDRGNFASIKDATLTIAPPFGESGTSVCTVTAADQFGLSRSISFAITVGDNRPPVVLSIADQFIKVGEVRSVPVMSADPNGNSGLKLSVVSSPAFAVLTDNGDGTGILKLAPSLADRPGGRVTVKATDPGGFSAQTAFNVIIQTDASITNATFSKPNLFINGVGFGQAGAKVLVNGKDVSASVANQTDTSITLKGGKKKLNLSRGPNQIVVMVGGSTSNAFVLNL